MFWESTVTPLLQQRTVEYLKKYEMRIKFTKLNLTQYANELNDHNQKVTFT